MPERLVFLFTPANEVYMKFQMKKSSSSKTISIENDKKTDIITSEILNCKKILKLSH